MALTVIAPERVALPGLAPIARVTLLVALATVIPLEFSIAPCTAGAMGPLTVVPEGCWLKASWAGLGFVLNAPGTMRPIAPKPVYSVNHKLPSGPAVILGGSAPAEMPVVNSVTTPVRVMR